MDLFQALKKIAKVVVKPYKSRSLCPSPLSCRDRSSNSILQPMGRLKTDEEDQQQESSASLGGIPSKKKQDEGQYFPSNYNVCSLLFKLMMKALLIVLGLGFWRVRKIQEKKERHTWAVQVMNELVQNASFYKYHDNGWSPPKNLSQEAAGCAIPDFPPATDNVDTSQNANTNAVVSSLVAAQRKDQNGSEKRDMPILLAAKMGLTELVDKFLNNYPAAIQELNTAQKNLVLLTYEKNQIGGPGKKETPILIAAKMGISEIVEKILDTFPVAVQDLDSNKKNVVLLAVENRQILVYKLLLGRQLLKENVFHQVDDQGNSALHLAAMFGDHRPWLIPGAALQMQWEMKWYEFVRNSTPARFFVRYNKNGQTPKDIFTHTHTQTLSKAGVSGSLKHLSHVQWLLPSLLQLHLPHLPLFPVVSTKIAAFRFFRKRQFLVFLRSLPSLPSASL
ncbi:uncharacterized protein LOC131145619 [Malania oleifera]|uniref:uncharacterized protein LOC131145619 n=1 Tax=Malania oleifera TaxID=397392 RepID=UPI0025AE386A|nr:uncharacterized protein LOC131145619 [Malania oleifera]